MSSSWQNASSWYDNLVGEKGHYYHQHVIFPNLLKILQTHTEKQPQNPKEPLQKNEEVLSLLDLACGQGALSRNLPKNVRYTGVDLAKDLIGMAKKRKTNPLHDFFIADVTKPMSFIKKDSFDAATLVLSLQDIEEIKPVLTNAFSSLKNQGLLIIVLNHPCFRIPRQTFWKTDEKNNVQYRCIQSYLSPLKIPIQIEPSKKDSSKQVFSHHRPLSTYTKALHDAGFCISFIEEWISDKQSEGSCAKRENFAREQFPLFLTIVAKKH